MSDTFDQYIHVPDDVFLNRKEDTEKREPSYDQVKQIGISNDGFFVIYKDIDVPLKGFPDRRFLFAVGAVKAGILMLVRILQSAPYLLPFVWLARKKILRHFARFSNKVLRDYYLQPQYYMPSSQEIYRVGIDFLAKEPNFDLVMAAVMIWEYDDAYRYRGLFVLSQLNKESLRRNAKAEVKRLLDILIQRENNVTMKDKWRAVKRLVAFLPARMFTVLQSLDLEKLKMDANDIYWATHKESVSFNFN